MSGEHDHDEIIEGISEQLRGVFDGSSQGIYVYLDDRHKACNRRFAEMLGYPSAAAWNHPGAFTEQYVDEQSWDALVATYRRAMEHHAAATVEVTWKRRDGTLLPTSVILAPIAFRGETLAMHFVTPR